MTGQTLGTYALGAVIGHGPRATLYRARPATGDRVVAVKVYDETVDPDRVQQAFESGRALTHAHTLLAEDFGVQRGLAWTAVRYMPVGSIKSRWRGVVPLSDLTRIVPQVASALDHAHEHGLLHLNLKPSNILLDHPGNAFVADFGLPAPIDSPYAAPEIARGGLIDARADVYALGAVLYELVTGHAPAARRPRAESANQRMAELPAPRSIRAGIAPAFEAMIMRALSIDPESRYATPGDLARAFAEAAEVAASQPREARPMRVPALGWIGAGIAGIVLLIGALVVSSGANAPAAVPSLAPPTTIAATATKPAARTETPSPEPTPTRARTATPAPSTASPTVQSTTAVPSTTARSTLPVAQTVTVTAIRPSATAAFRVISLDLKPPANRDAPGERLDLLFDAVIEPSTGGPFGQLFAYLPDIDSYVTSRIGAQVSSGTQVLHVTLVVNCAELPAPFTTQRLFLEIRPNDRGPALYAQTIDYMKIWCR